jgi:hypothetical protein
MPSLSSQDVTTLLRIIRKVDGMSGPGIVNTPDNIAFCPPAVAAARPSEDGGAGGLFPVLVEKTGGSDGSLTTVASWTYTVYDFADTVLATAAPLGHPRPNGMMTYQAGADGYGLAFYGADGALVLWDAGEVPTTGPCA